MCVFYQCSLRMFNNICIFKMCALLFVNLYCLIYERRNVFFQDISMIKAFSLFILATLDFFRTFINYTDK